MMTPDYASMKLIDREILFQALHPNLPETNYFVLWEDPSDLEAPLQILVPSPSWIAMAMHGGILPPVEVFHELAEDEACDDFENHTRGHLLHETPPVGPMTEEEAMIYLAKKDIPPRVWRDYKGNRVILKIIHKSVLPTDRTVRDAWQVSQPDEALEAA